MAKYELTFTTEVEARVVVEAENQWEARALLEDGDIEDFVDNMRDICYHNSETCVYGVEEI